MGGCPAIVFMRLVAWSKQVFLLKEIGVDLISKLGRKGEERELPCRKFSIPDSAFLLLDKEQKYDVSRVNAGETEMQPMGPESVEKELTGPGS